MKKKVNRRKNKIMLTRTTPSIEPVRITFSSSHSESCKINIILECHIWKEKTGLSRRCQVEKAWSRFKNTSWSLKFHDKFAVKESAGMLVIDMKRQWNVTQLVNFFKFSSPFRFKIYWYGKEKLLNGHPSLQGVSGSLGVRHCSWIVEKNRVARRMSRASSYRTRESCRGTILKSHK